MRHRLDACAKLRRAVEKRCSRLRTVGFVFASGQLHFQSDRRDACRARASTRAHQCTPSRSINACLRETRRAVSGGSSVRRNGLEARRKCHNEFFRRDERAGRSTTSEERHMRPSPRARHLHRAEPSRKSDHLTCSRRRLEAVDEYMITDRRQERRPGGAECRGANDRIFSVERYSRTKFVWSDRCVR